MLPRRSKMPKVSVEEIRSEVEAIIRRVRPDVSGEIHDADRLRDDLGLDSIHSMELLSAVTEKYEVDVDMEEVQDISTVGDVVGFLAKLTA
jgi:acyl carrier protein